MRQLSWTDDMMLRAETPAAPLQIQLLLIYDPSTAPGGKVTFPAASRGCLPPAVDRAARRFS
jgi:hypothetical protein